jgi:hypothetical protein
LLAEIIKAGGVDYRSSLREQFVIGVSPKQFVTRVRHGSSTGVVYASSRQMKNGKKLLVYVM